jgi:hypothetical protein
MLPALIIVIFFASISILFFLSIKPRPIVKLNNEEGVFEKINYPWFRPIFFDLPNGISDFCAEDVGFCKLAIEQGFKIFIEPTVILGHEKSKIY